MTRHAEEADTSNDPTAPVVRLRGVTETSRELTLAFERLGAVVTGDEAGTSMSRSTCGSRWTVRACANWPPMSWACRPRRSGSPAAWRS
jgi:hypothetical protein